jgi:hypothetical protein
MSAPPLIMDDREMKEKYDKDYKKLLRKLQMDYYMLEKPKDKKPVNCETTPYKLIRSKEKDLEKTFNQIIKENQKGICLK